jgi:glycosyltransferase involved in cell wall biosynthesis
VLEAFSTMREKDRFVRGMFAWMGFRQTTVGFHRLERAAGTTKYPLKKMLRLAANGIVGFSDAPLRVALWAGMALSLLALVYASYVAALALARADLVPGWSSTIIVTALLSGMNMFMTGLMGLYVGRIYNEVKGRPLYLIERSIGFDGIAQSAASGPPAGLPAGNGAPAPKAVAR